MATIQQEEFNQYRKQQEDIQIAILEQREFEDDMKHKEILLRQRQQQLEQEENNWQLQRNEEIYQQQLFKRKENKRRKEEDIEWRAQKLKQQKKITDLLINN